MDHLILKEQDTDPRTPNPDAVLEKYTRLESERYCQCEDRCPNCEKLRRPEFPRPYLYPFSPWGPQNLPYTGRP